LNGGKTAVNVLLGLGLLLSVMQVGLGTQVREEIDAIASGLGGAGRDTWIEKLGIPFYIHRSFSLLVLGVNLGLVWLLRKQGAWSGALRFFVISLLAVIVVSILSGAALAYFAIPAVLQPVHLLLAALLAGIQFTLLLLVNQRKVLSQQGWKVLLNNIPTNDHHTTGNNQYWATGRQSPGILRITKVPPLLYGSLFGRHRVRHGRRRVPRLAAGVVRGGRVYGHRRLQHPQPDH
jgi:hypothetical protein